MGWAGRNTTYNSAVAAFAPGFGEHAPAQSDTVTHQTIIVLDFGSQYTQLIARRLRELSVYAEIWPYNTPLEELRAASPVGVILSGGPRSVSDAGSPRCDAGVLHLGVPVLGICYGMQLLTSMLGGEVGRAPQREYGDAVVS